MIPVETASVAALTFAASLATTPLVRWFARRRDLLDRPNARSAHATPTPRLGGVGLIVPFIVAGAWCASTCTPLHGRSMLAVLGGTLFVSAVGLVDDLRPLPARWRLAVQVLAASGVVLSQERQIVMGSFPFGTALPYALVVVGSIVWIVWVTNLYNFMDGIDGLAGGQAIFASLGLAGAALTVGDPCLASLLAMLAASAAGFLGYNLPKASIFMGDVGSTAIGFFLAAVPLAGAGKPVPLIAVLLALALFVLDATITLLRRFAQGEKLYAAHRTHLYQRPLAFGVSHARITYAAYGGMAIVAGMAAFCPVVALGYQFLMLSVAAALFAVAWFTVRRVETRGVATRAGE